ncbi:MAG: putative endonuclease [Chloroflexi bacterium]|jgi:putative endonuclease|nr:MAG: putative endonuclease [Chloroflexota bacterium]
MSDPRQGLGRAGETVAAQYLQDAGYTVLERNRRSEGGEIDIVARDTSGAIVFVEVRTRRGPGGAVSALESVDAAKQERLLSGAAAYLADHVDPSGADLPARIDVIAVATNRRGGLAVARHVRNAVEA